MSRIVVAGTLDELSKTLEIASKLGTVHVLDYDGEIEDINLGTPEPLADDVSTLLTKVRGCVAELNPTAGPRQSLKQIRKVLSGDFSQLVESITDKINLLEDTKNLMEKNAQSTSIASKLTKLGLELELLGDYNSLSCWVGEFEDLTRLLENLKTVPGSLSFTDGNTKKGVAAVFCEKDFSDKVQSIVSESNFDQISIPEGTGSAETLIERLEKDAEELISNIEKLESELEELSNKHGEDLLAGMEVLERDLEILNAPVRVAVSEHAFVVDGWIPTSSVKESSVALKMVSTIVETEKFEQSHGHGHGHGHEEEMPPIAYTERNISKPFELLTDLVGRPKYGRIDPTMFMLITYPLFFGMMLGDMMYGIFTIILGLWIKNKFNNNESALLASRLIIYVGIACVIFGYIYAEFAGWEIFLYEKLTDGNGYYLKDASGHYIYGENQSPIAFLSVLYPELDHGYGPTAVLPFGITLAFPFHRVGTHMSDLIIIALYLGVIHLALGFLIGIRDVAREHGFAAAFFEKGSWLLVLIGGFLACYGYIAGKNDGWSDAYIGVLNDLILYGGITLGIGVACVSYGLAKYEGFGAVGIFVGPLETISLLSNTLSYIRLMAIGTVGVKIAEAGNMLGFENMILAFEEVFSHGDIMALITGIAALMLWVGVQIFAWVLGVFSPNIHAARLHFVEWMKQFYDGSGEPFKPFGSKPKLVEVE